MITFLCILNIQKQNFKYVLDLKQVIALKLYCDFEFLQCEYKKCFRSPHNQNQVRLQSFYHWNKILLSAIKKLSDSRVKFHHKLRFDDKKFKSVYHGVSSILDMKNIEISSNHIHKFYGPLSTTTDIFIARSFAGSKGMIIEIEFRRNGVDKQDITVPIDVTFFSTFPEEQEILCFDQSICIKNVMLSTEFDAKYLRDLPNN